MQSGVISKDNLSQVLRGISQKRKQGILEINSGDLVLQVMFIGGKIVEVYETPELAIQQIISKVGAAGVLPDDFEYSGDSYIDLFQELKAAGCPLDLDEFKVVVQQRVLSSLYNLDLQTGAYYAFKVQMVEIESDFVQPISVGQLLLDLVALKDDEEEYLETFPKDHILSVSGDGIGANIEEGFILHVAESYPTVLEAEAGSMLSTFHFRESLFALHKRGAVSVAEFDESAVNADEGDNQSIDDIVAALEGSLETEIDESEFDDIGTSEASIVDTMDTGAVVERGIEADNVQEIEAVHFSIFAVWNAKLLQAEWVPGILVMLLLLSALFCPFLAWDECIKAFSSF